MKKLLSILYSTRLTAILFVVFVAAMGIATFIENDHGTQTAQKLVYNAWWFEAIMVFFVINFFGNIFKYRLYKKEKWSVLLFHVSFLFILIGAGITRYISYEGIMPIIEGESSNIMFSQTNYFDVIADDGKDQKIYTSDKILLSAIGKPNYSFTNDFRGKEFTFNLVEYLPNAKEVFEETENGDNYLYFVESTLGSRHDHYIKKGTSQLIHNVLVGFDNVNNNSIDIITIEDSLKIITNSDGTFFRMSDSFNGTILKDSIQDFQFLALHQLAGLSFVVPTPAIRGIYKTVKTDEEALLDRLIFDVTVGDKTKQLVVNGGQYNIGEPQKISVDTLNFRVNYGSKQIKLPFHIKLRDFQLENYPGSQSPMSYASEVTVIDPKETFDFRIYMNHILNYKGYKFFQSSYDIKDEYEETHLSVNHDFWGTLITYIGYAMLFLGLILILFVKNTRFSHLRNTLRKIENKKTVLTLALLITFATSFSQHNTHQLTEQQTDSILQANIVDKLHAEEYSKLIIQDAGGRMKPIHTFASELLRKVHHSDTFKGMDANQVAISIQQNPRFWFNIPIIYIKKGNTKLRDVIGISQNQKYAQVSDFFTDKGVYKIADEQEKAFKQKIKSKYQQSIIDVDRRVNLLYSAIFGDLFTIFPVPNDATDKWVSQNQLETKNFSGTDSVFVKQILPVYLQTLSEAKKTNDYSQSEDILTVIKKFQKKYGSAVYPSENKIDLELFYNKYDIFKSLFKYYLYAGTLLFILVIIRIFKTSKTINLLIKIGTFIIVGLFIYHMIGLGIRWYISGHAPWSNGYESMIYVSWATMLFGLILGRKSALTIAATTFVVSVILMVAHWNWIDPSIGNLVPVLDSYWLMIHVAIIVASYGPFVLSMILGTLALFLMLATTENNKKKLGLIIKEITIINEMSMTVGLILLAIGNFLGGIWANESWGRYWGWDPKETWALISIMVYAFVIHTRLVPGIRGRFTFNTLSVFSFAAILMTYLGVNHLLSGLHSYAVGEEVPIPMQIWAWLGFSTILSIFAYFKYRKYYKK